MVSNKWLTLLLLLTFVCVRIEDIGEAWASMPHNLCAALVAARGYSVVARTDPSSTARNVISLRMFMDALPLQPCNPTFKSLYVFLLKRDTEPEFFFGSHYSS